MLFKIHEVAIWSGSDSICNGIAMEAEVQHNCSFDYRAKKTLQETVQLLKCFTHVFFLELLVLQWF